MMLCCVVLLAGIFLAHQIIRKPLRTFRSNVFLLRIRLSKTRFALFGLMFFYCASDYPKTASHFLV